MAEASRSPPSGARDPPDSSSSAPNTPPPPPPDTEESRLTPSQSHRHRSKKRKARSSSPEAAAEEEESSPPSSPGSPHLAIHRQRRQPTTAPPAPPPSPISHGQLHPPRPPLGKIQGKVVITKDKASAARFAKKYSDRREDDPDAANILPIFTDGSASHIINEVKDHFCSASAVFRPHPTSYKWLERGYPLLLAIDSLNAEVFGLGRGLRDGRGYIRQHPEMQIHTLYIFTDLMKFLEMLPRIEEGIWDVVKRGYLEEFLALDAELAEAGINVEYHWVPGHKGVEGNVRADRTSRKYRPDVKYPEIFQTLPQPTHEEQVRNARANREKKRKNRENESAETSQKGKKRARTDYQE